MSASWLRQIEVADGVRGRLAACWRLFHYKHPKPDQATATTTQLAAYSEREALRRALAETNLSKYWVKTFAEIAIAKAKEQEGQAQMAQFLSWCDWMHEGPAVGLRKQHQLT